MKKTRVMALFALALCGVIISLQLSTTVEAANIEVSSEKIRVFIGSTDGMTAAQANNYARTQSDLLNNFVVSAPEDIGSALITFEAFISQHETEALLNTVNSIDTIYMWIPNKEGRAIIDVTNNDVKGAITNFFASLDLENVANEDYKSDMLELMANYGIFAAEVTAEYSVLNGLTNQDSIISVDVIYSEVAMTMADKTGKSISYICIPAKPDGTA